MATHSSVLAWRIPGTGEPGGLQSMGSHRVRHDWSDLAAAAVAQISFRGHFNFGYNLEELWIQFPHLPHPWDSYGTLRSIKYLPGIQVLGRVLRRLKWLRFIHLIIVPQASLVVQMVKNPPAMKETWVWFLDWEDSLEESTATHCSILAWRIPWTEEPGRLQSTGSSRVDVTKRHGTVPQLDSSAIRQCLASCFLEGTWFLPCWSLVTVIP